MKEFNDEKFRRNMKISFDYNYAIEEYLQTAGAVTINEIYSYKEKCSAVIKAIKKTA